MGSPPLIFSSAPPLRLNCRRCFQDSSNLWPSWAASCPPARLTTPLWPSWEPVEVLASLCPCSTSTILSTPPVLPLTCPTLRPRLSQLGLLELTSSRLAWLELRLS